MPVPVPAYMCQCKWQYMCQCQHIYVPVPAYICASAAKHSRCGRTWNVTQLEKFSKRILPIRHSQYCLCVCSTRVLPLTAQFQTITPCRSECRGTVWFYTMWCTNCMVPRYPYSVRSQMVWNHHQRRKRERRNHVVAVWSQ